MVLTVAALVWIEVGQSCERIRSLSNDATAAAPPTTCMFQYGARLWFRVEFVAQIKAKLARSRRSVRHGRGGLGEDGWMDGWRDGTGQR